MFDLSEGMADTKRTYVETGKVPEDVFKSFMDSDWSKSKKYVDWMCRQYVANPERASHIVDLVKQFAAAVDRKKITGEEADIYRYNFESLDKKVDEVSQTQTKGEKKNDFTVLYEDDDCIMFRPLTHDASYLYRMKYIEQSPTYQACKEQNKEDKTWCTTRKGNSYWNQYWREGVNLYYIFNKKTKESYAVAQYPNGRRDCFDVLDRSIQYVDVLRKIGYSEDQLKKLGLVK